jgi:hypothetical protein
MNRILIVVVLLLSAAGWAQTAPKPVLKTDVAPNAPRFQLFVNPTVRADTFLLDTVTGKIWCKMTFTNLVGEPDAWIAEDRIDGDDDLMTFLQKHTNKPSAKPASGSQQ